MTAVVITTAVVLATRGDPTRAHTGPPAAAVDPGTASPTSSATPVTFTPGAAGSATPTSRARATGGTTCSTTTSTSPTAGLASPRRCGHDHRYGNPEPLPLRPRPEELPGRARARERGQGHVHAARSKSCIITPTQGLPKGKTFNVKVSYSGTPHTVLHSPIVFGAPYGWIYTDDGAFVGCEPNAASTWFPSNDHPSDKATFTFNITVPAGTKVVANGDLTGGSSGNGMTTFIWDEKQPMATYLATIDIGKWGFTPPRPRAASRSSSLSTRR